MKRWLWLGGWGLTPQWQAELLSRYWSDVEHEVLYPGELCMTKFYECLATGDVTGVGGYSLGACLLLREFQEPPNMPVQLLAPIFDFNAEAAKGGRLKRAHLHALLRWLRRDPLAALNDFYQQAGLEVDSVKTLPYKVEDLIWGIEQLQSTSVEYSRWKNVRALIGERDALLDPVMMQQLWPELTILPNAGHDLNELLKEAAV